MLYYLRQEVIGDQAERILEGADSRLVDVPYYISVFILESHLLNPITFQRKISFQFLTLVEFLKNAFFLSFGTRSLSVVIFI